MKSRFTTLDLVCEVRELQRLVGMRVNQVYDVDAKTYLLRLHRPPEDKAVLLVESGARIHSTAYDWPKGAAPSGFSMKLRKHLNNKRLESLGQMGADRVVDMQFGVADAAHHLILELYDRGNLVLTDCDYKILNVLRPRVQGEEKFLVRETYPVELARERRPDMTEDRIAEIFAAAKPGENVKKICAPHFEYGPPFFEHLLLNAGLTNFKLTRDFQLDDNTRRKLVDVFNSADAFLKDNEPAGFVVQKREMRPKAADSDETEEFLSYVEFHPFSLLQNADRPKLELATFDAAIDEFYSKVESQKIELRAVQQERQAMKKLENVRKDHEVRLGRLKEEQAQDRRRAELIEMNEALVDAALAVMRSAIANQVDWKEIGDLVKEATDNGDPVASKIKKLKLETNHFSMLLADPYSHLGGGGEEDNSSQDDDVEPEPAELVVDIDIDLSAQANARKYYTHKKSAAAKEQKTLDSHSTAIKSAEKKTKQTLKEVAAITNINKARRTFWFEKFFWFVSSENYLVVAGRDMQQNELLVKRYLRPGDLYVHADLHGASSVVVKNPGGLPVPPKTLNEAGQMAACYSVAWESKVVVSAWWVEASQVSKTAPSGEYLTQGSFMIRGKKNYLLPAHLILGFGFLFKLEESSVERHKDERKVRTANDDLVSLASESEPGASTAAESLADELEEVEIAVDEGASSEEEVEEKEEKEKLEEIKEEEQQDDDKEDGVPKQGIEEERKDDSSDGGGGGDDDDGGGAFPDTSVDIDYTKGGEAKVKARGLSESSDHHRRGEGGGGGVDQDDAITFVASQQGRQKQQKEARAQKKAKEEQKAQQQEGAGGSGEGGNKRGKKGKMKKMREKYKDQDDEERELRMQILQGSQKENKKRREKKGGGGGGSKRDEQQQQKQKPKPQQQQQQRRQQPEEDEPEEVTVSAEVDMLDTLTGQPVAEDELLFAVPVVAPYSVLNNYRFKVKLTPGAGKRGKATKTALAMFMADRSVTQREKDLLKSVKDQDLARNLPGKVKLSAPHLQKVKQGAKKKNKQ